MEDNQNPISSSNDSDANSQTEKNSQAGDSKQPQRSQRSNRGRRRSKPNQRNRTPRSADSQQSGDSRQNKPSTLQNGSNQRVNGQQNDQRNDNKSTRPSYENGNRVNNDRNNSTNEPWGMNPRRIETGIQTRSQRGEFAKNWWARRWLEALERLMQGVRLTRGQHYARIGQIVSMEEIKGGMAARVQGSRPKPYRVTIQLTPFNNKQWEKVFDILSDKAVYVAQLLAGDMPQDIEEVFNEAGVSLFPNRTSDLQTKCTCPDKVTPCKHVAATHYILGDRFDEDPFLLFRMRGKSQDQIMQALRQRRGADIDLAALHGESPTWQNQPEVLRFPETLESFWETGSSLKEVNVQVRMPNIPQPLLKRLGEPEVASQLTLQGQLEESYNAISQFAIMIAFADTSGGASNGNGDEEQ